MQPNLEMRRLGPSRVDSVGVTVLANTTVSFRLLGRAAISPAGCVFAARRCSRTDVRSAPVWLASSRPRPAELRSPGAFGNAQTAVAYELAARADPELTQ
jgi:hypothetical protein